MIWTICQSPPKSSPNIFFEFLHIGGSKFYGEEKKPCKGYHPFHFPSFLSPKQNLKMRYSMSPQCAYRQELGAIVNLIQSTTNSTSFRIICQYTYHLPYKLSKLLTRKYSLRPH